MIRAIISIVEHNIRETALAIRVLRQRVMYQPAMYWMLSITPPQGR